MLLDSHKCYYNHSECESLLYQIFICWRVFEDLCSFLQEQQDEGKAFSTVKVYFAAIAVCHVGFMSYTSRLSPVFKHLVPTWDLATVLDPLFHPPFEPLGQVDLKVLSRLSCC